MINQQYPVLTDIDSHIKPLLIGVLSADKLGVCYGPIEIDSISSSCGKEKGDRFRLSIPYARQNLTWNVFFDSECPEMGPDFIFNDNTFLADVGVDTLSIEVPSLTKWNPNNKNALLNVLVELLSCYKQHQMQLLQKQERLELEYNMLVKSELKPEDVEMILLPYGSKPTEARFLISLSVDISQLETRPCESKSDTAMLFVSFSGTDWSHITAQLYLSKSLEEIFSGLTLNVPPFPSDKFLIDYVPEVKKCITEKINLIIHNIELRRQYISIILTKVCNSIIEYDTVNYTYISFLLYSQKFHVTVHIELPPGFPNEKPLVIFISVYHMKEEHTPYSEIIQNYPYNLDWPLPRNIDELLNHITQYVEKFKFNSVKKYY